MIDPTGFVSEDNQELSKYGTAVELVIETQYANDPDFFGDNIYFGDDTSIGCGVGKNTDLCPDILNYDQKHYMEIKPFTKKGRKRASEKMGIYKNSLQPTYMPNTSWKTIPNIGMGIADNQPFIYFNDEGVLFYTPRTHLYEAIAALSVLGSAKRRSQLKKWREGKEPETTLSPAFQISPSGINQDYTQQITAALIIAMIAAATTAKYGFA